MVNRLKKIKVAPTYFLFSDYFSYLDKAFNNWQSKEFSRIRKKYGDDFMIYATKKDCFEYMDKDDAKMKKRLSARQYGRWRKDRLKCFLALVEVGDMGENSKSFYYSFFIYLVSYLEHIMNKVCQEYCKRYSFSLQLKDISGTGLNRALNYIEKVCKLNLPDKELVNKILLMRDIRNCLAHAGGEVSDPNLLKILLKERGVKIFDEYCGKTIDFTSLYCSHGIKNIEKFIRTLIQKNKNHLD